MVINNNPSRLCTSRPRHLDIHSLFGTPQYLKSTLGSDTKTLQYLKSTLGQRCHFLPFFAAEKGSEKLFWSCERSRDAVLKLIF